MHHTYLIEFDYHRFVSKPYSEDASESEAREPDLSSDDKWYYRAACAYDVDRMFPSQPKDLSYIVEARKVCASCTVIDECLEYALSFSLVDMAGFWAGKTVRQLNLEQKERGITPKRSTLSQVWSQLGR